MKPNQRAPRPPLGNRADLQNLKRLLPYIWAYRGRVLLALGCLVIAKVATVAIPLLLKHIVDALDTPQGQALAIPIVLLVAYGGLRLANSLFSQLRDALFARARFGAMQRLSNQVVAHLHTLSLRFHLERHTGHITRDLERGTRSVNVIVNNMVLTILPTIAEFLLVAGILLGSYDLRFALAVVVAVVIYIAFTLTFTDWRMGFRHRMNHLESAASAQAIDSLLNYETVKYFNNEAYEIERHERTLSEWQDMAVKSVTTMSMLNFVQGAIIALAVTVIMVFAAQGVAAGSMTLGDLVMVNTLMLQLFMPLNTLGMTYRALKYGLADMDLILKLLDREGEIQDRADAKALQISEARVRFKQVDFAYHSDRPILTGIDFEIPPGHKVAIVGPSGAGKSTLARLLFRFYDVSDGQVCIDAQDVRSLTQSSLRQAIGIVPQDTVLFNETIRYNIQYADPAASHAQVEHAAKVADMHEFIRALPQGYDTVVGERGLKLSGGEKQRLAIARVVLKQPEILVFDEATSSLDTRSEQAILAALGEVSRRTTTLVIAHRLSTVVDADQILVMEHGRIMERGGHRGLLAMNGLYAHLWSLQQEERELDEEIADDAMEVGS